MAKTIISSFIALTALLSHVVPAAAVNPYEGSKIEFGEAGNILGMIFADLLGLDPGHERLDASVHNVPPLNTSSPFGFEPREDYNAPVGGTEHQDWSNNDINSPNFGTGTGDGDGGGSGGGHIFWVLGGHRTGGARL